MFCFEDFNQKSLNVSMLVTHIIVSLQQCFEVTRMVIKYSSQCSLMYCVLGGSGTEHPNVIRMPYEMPFASRQKAIEYCKLRTADWNPN